jgi:tripartite ATP-independent transporter DctM subunit
LITSTLVLIAALVFGIPVAFSIGLSALAYFWVAGANLLVLPQQFVGQLSTQPLIAIPFFILAGELMNTGGVTRRIFAFALAVLGRTPGGLGHTNVLAMMIFSGVSGSAVADLASVGKIGLKAMRDNDYPDDMSVGVITSASTIGPIIPPSINMVIFGSIANVPVGLLFLGGFLPGILTGIMLMITFAYLFRRRRIKVRVPAPVPFLRTAREAFWSLTTPIVLLGAMFTGIATPTEAAILAVVYTLLVSGLIHRELRWVDFFDALLNTAVVSGAILIIIGFAAPLAYVIAREQVALELSAFMVGSFEKPGLLLLLLVAALLLAVGCFMEVVAALILLTPVLGTALINAKLDPVFIGVMMVYTLGIGLVTPPVGMCLYVGSQISGMRLERVVTATAPFIVPLVLTLLLMILFPAIVTWVPNLVYGK